MARTYVSMERTDDEKLDALPTLAPALKDQPDYPYGLRISLTQSELDKLGLDVSTVKINDIIDMRCFARVRSTSSDMDEGGKPCCRVELQITDMAVENENDEEPAPAPARKRPPYIKR